MMKTKTLIALCCIAIFMLGCTRTVYVPTTQVKTEYKDREVVRIDSAYVRDSIYIHAKGDTIWLEKYQYRYIYKDKLIRDSIIVRDSISYPVYVDVIKEVKHIPKLYKFCFWICIALAGFGVFKLIRFFKVF